MRRVIMCFLAVVGVVFATGCSNETTNENEVTRIYIAHVLDESTENTSWANEMFRAALEEYLGIEVIHMTEVSHVIGIEAMRSGHLDLMFASAFSIVNAQEVLDIEIAGTLNHSEVNPLTTLFITNNDEISDLSDLEGHSFAFVTPVSASGYFFPAFHLIREFDLTPELVTQPGYFFSSTVFSGSHETSITGVSLGDYDAAAVITTVFNSVINSGIIGPESINIISETSPHPDSSYIMRSDLPEDLKNQIRSFFMNWDNEEYYLNAWGFSELRFIPGNYDALDDIRLMLEMLDDN